jgi:stalled ribosome rescue protein Dom34
MPHCALIMDQSHARIIEFTKDASEFHKVEKKTHHFHHHSSHEGTEDRKKFFQLLASELKSYKQILILGAGIGKDQFKKYLDEHNHEISKNILSIITIDHPTDHQILAKAKEFFKDHHIPL